MKDNLRLIKVNKSGKEFLDRFNKMRVRHNINNDILSYAKLLEKIEKYFKLNNDKYVELVTMEEKYV